MSDAVLRLRDEGLAWRAVEDEVVVLTHDERYLGVNPSGSKLWKALADGTTRSTLVDLLAAEGATGDQAEADLDTFLDDLRARGLLQA